MLNYNLILLFVFSAPLQSFIFGLENTPIFLLFYMIIFMRYNLIHISAFLLFCILSILIFKDVMSLIKIVGSIFTFYLSLNVKGVSIFKVRKSYLYIIILLLASEQFLSFLGIYSPLIRDNSAALFIFSEKSYAAQFIIYFATIYYIFSDDPKRLLSTFIFLVFSYICLRSFYIPFFLLLSFFGYFFKNLKPMTILIIVSSIVIFTLFAPLTEYFQFIHFLPFSNLLRLLTNSVAYELSFNSFSGSIYFQNLEFYQHSNVAYNFLYLDYILDWDKISAQAIVPNFASFFGFWAVVPFVFYCPLFFAKATVRYHGFASYLLIEILIINLFVQGFLINPYVLALVPLVFSSKIKFK